MKPESVKKLSQGLIDLAQQFVAACAKHDFDKGCDCCEIPETKCPPRCAGEIHWTFARGATPAATIVVRNVGKVARNFTFTATPLAGLQPGSAHLTVSPASVSLAPMQTVIVNVKLADSLSLQACQDYRAEVLIKGSWEQCVAFTARVVRDPFDATAVEQSDSIKEKAFPPAATKGGLNWEFDRGVMPSAKVTITNAGRTTTTFGLETTALVGIDTTTARVVVAPDSVRLGGGQSSVVRLELEGSNALSPGQTYESELRVKGYYEQRIDIRSSVQPDPSGHVEVEQGEPPTHIHAHHWYHHFQCTEPCTPT